MEKACGNFFQRYLSYIRASRMLITNEASYLHRVGWMRSLRDNKPVGCEGRALPWMNYSVVDFLRDRLAEDLDLFEYGSGYSTYFFAGRVRTVTSLEYDEAWFKNVENAALGNVEVIFRHADVDGDYCRAIHKAGKQYDVVVIDGRDRVNCIRQAIGALTDPGVIVLDDSQRDRYQEGISHLAGAGFRVLPFTGLKPTSTKLVQTSIFYRPGNCLGI